MNNSVISSGNEDDGRRHLRDDWQVRFIMSRWVVVVDSSRPNPDVVSMVEEWELVD